MRNASFGINDWRKLQRKVRIDESSLTNDIIRVLQIGLPSAETDGYARDKESQSRQGRGVAIITIFVGAVFMVGGIWWFAVA